MKLNSLPSPESFFPKPQGGDLQRQKRSTKMLTAFRLKRSSTQKKLDLRAGNTGVFVETGGSLERGGTRKEEKSFALTRGKREKTGVSRSVKKEEKKSCRFGNTGKSRRGGYAEGGELRRGRKAGSGSQKRGKTSSSLA